MGVASIIFIACIAFFALRGYRQGLLACASSLVSLAAGYVCALLLGPQLGLLIEQHTSLAGLLALMAGSGAAFIAAALTVKLLTNIVKHKPKTDENISRGSALGGALLNLVFGAALGLLLIWLTSLVRPTLTEATPIATTQKSSDPIEKLAHSAAGKLVAGAMTAAGKGEFAQASAAIASAPAVTTQQLKDLQNNPALLQLFHDPANQTILNSGDTSALESIPALQQLARDPSLQGLLQRTQLLDESASDQQAQQILAEKISDLWLRFAALRDHPRARAILQSEDFRQSLEAGNPLTLLNDPRLEELGQLLFSVDPHPISTSHEPHTDKPQPSSKPATIIYQWTDERGRQHYGDQQRAVTN